MPLYNGNCVRAYSQLNPSEGDGVPFPSGILLPPPMAPDVLPPEPFVADDFSGLPPQLLASLLGGTSFFPASALTDAADPLVSLAGVAASEVALALAEAEVVVAEAAPESPSFFVNLPGTGEAKVNMAPFLSFLTG